MVDDDFDDFQAAPPSAGPTTANLAFTSAPAPAPIQAASPPVQQFQSNANLFSMLGSTTTTSPPPMTANRAPSYMGTAMTPAPAPNYSPSVMTPSNPVRTGSIGGAPATSAVTTPAAKPASSGNFDDLWTMSLGSSASKPQTPTTQTKSIQDLQREKAQAGIWGATQSQQGRPPMGAGFGSFGASSASGSTSNAAPPSSSSNGLDDLLL